MILSTCFILFALSLQGYNIVTGVHHDAHTGHLTVELLIVADYSAFTRWYNRSDASWSDDRRLNETTTNIKEYLTALVHSSNTVFASLEQYNVSVSVKLVDVVVMTTVQSAFFTEDAVMNSTEGTIGINEDIVFEKFKPVSVKLQTNIPHDHAMVFTTYDVLNSTGGLYAGVAEVAATCLSRSMSIVEDDGFETVFVMAHELGHSLGSRHDGANNTCVADDGYVMDPELGDSYTNMWLFSKCSADYIKNYTNKLIRDHNNCMVTVNNHHVDQTIHSHENELYGQVYSHDEQCKIINGPDSYFCREIYNNTDEFVCYNMKCKVEGEDACSWTPAGEGTPCGQGKWCMKGECVQSKNTPINVTDDCFAGQHVGVFGFATCDEIGTHHRSTCDRENVRRACCEACAGYGDVQTTSTDIDGQCRSKLGPTSYMCRTATTYKNTTYQAVVCSKLLCADPDDPGNYCNFITADDRTACGYKKWCQNGVCVHDDAAPEVADDCPWGDQKVPIEELGLTCGDIKQPKYNYYCYRPGVQKLCCSTCNALRTNITGCEYGDRHPSCIPYFEDPTNINRYMCYTDKNSDICCGSCTKYRNDNIPDCEYGDKLNGCDSTGCATYTDSSLKGCCESCHSPVIVG